MSMKITLVTREFFPLTGGLQALAAQLGQELQKKGCDFEIVTRFTNERKALERHLTESEKDQVTERKSIRTHIIGHSYFSSFFYGVPTLCFLEKLPTAFQYSFSAKPTKRR